MSVPRLNVRVPLMERSTPPSVCVYVTVLTSQSSMYSPLRLGM